MDTNERKYVDMLVNHFWKLGYFTVSRRFGTYLPEPSNVGKFKVDIIGRQKNKYAIGITLSEEDLDDIDLIGKLEFLATRRTKNSNSLVTLIIGVQENQYKKIKNTLEKIEPELRKNIKLMQIVERAMNRQSLEQRKKQVAFS